MSIENHLVLVHRQGLAFVLLHQCGRCCFGVADLSSHTHGDFLPSQAPQEECLSELTQPLETLVGPLVLAQSESRACIEDVSLWLVLHLLVRAYTHTVAAIAHYPEEDKGFGID